MKRTKQILCVFLSVCMIISCMAGFTITAGAVTTDPGSTVYKVGDAIPIEASKYYSAIGQTVPGSALLVGGSLKLHSITVDGSNITVTLMNEIEDTLSLRAPKTGTTDPIGIKITGTGTQTDPHSFEVVYAASPTSPYHGYIHVQNEKYSFRNAWDEEDFGKDAGNNAFEHMVVWGEVGDYPDYDAQYDNNIEAYLLGSLTDAAITGEGKYTVSVNNFDWTLDGANSFNILGVSTDLPLAEGWICPSITVFIDGTSAITYLNPGNYDETYVHPCITFIYDPEFENQFTEPYPTKSLEIEFTIAKVSVSPEDAGYVIFNEGSGEGDWQLTAEPFEGWEFNYWSMKKNGAEATYAYNPLPTTAGCTDIVAHLKGHTHVWTYTGGESDTITANCSGEGKCDITTNPKIRIVAPAKKYENDNGTPDATLVVSENWSTELGLVAAPTEIFYVNLATETLLEAAPQTAGDYMAYTVIAVGDTLYSAGVEYSILSEDIPEHERVKPIPSSGSGSSSSGGSSSSSSSTSSSDVSGSSQSSQKMWAQLNDDHTVTVGWDKISGASKYVLIVEKDGKEVELATTSKTKITINRIAPNNITLNYKLKVKQGGVLSDAPTGYTTSLKVYYKPVVKLTNKDGKVTASWKKVPNATGYRIYKLVNGKMRLVTETESSAVRFKAKSGKKYTFAVSACVNGEWTKLYKSDRVSITAK